MDKLVIHFVTKELEWESFLVIKRSFFYRLKHFFSGVGSTEGAMCSSGVKEGFPNPKGCVKGDIIVSSQYFKTCGKFRFEKNDEGWGDGLSLQRWNTYQGRWKNLSMIWSTCETFWSAIGEHGINPDGEFFAKFEWKK